MDQSSTQSTNGSQWDFATENISPNTVGSTEHEATARREGGRRFHVGQEEE